MSTVVDCSSVTSYGPNRSVVRMVATILPIDTGQRVFVSLPHIDAMSPSSANSHHVFDLTSLAKDSRSVDRNREYPSEISDDSGIMNSSPATTTRKISSLEAELARLKAQIATYALTETEGIENNSTNGVMAPPPPPPPPPPIAPLTSSSDQSLPSPPLPSSSVPSSHEPPPCTPSMNTVLKDIGNVKLKNVGLERSPGGTPFRPPKRSNSTPSMDDPASVIAHALRKKFSHRIFQDSPDRDSTESSFNEFDSPKMTGVNSMPRTLQYDASS